jgi:hypothetical protein
MTSKHRSGTRSDHNGLKFDDPNRYPERRCPCRKTVRVPVTSAQTHCAQCLAAKKRKKQARRKKKRRDSVAKAEALLEAQRRADARDDARRLSRAQDGAPRSVWIVSGGLPGLGKRR